MAGAISAGSPHHKSGILEIHRQQLAPSPQSEIFAVTPFQLFKQFWGLPVVVSAELFLVGNIFAAQQESSDVREVGANVFKGLTDETADGKCRPEATLATGIGPKNLAAIGVIRVGNNLGEQSCLSASRSKDYNVVTAYR